MITCLLVEDDASLASFIMEGLTDKGYQVEQVSDGYEAATLISQNDYDIIVLDIMIPGIDGFEVCKLTRKRNIKSIIIILSALANYEEKIKGLEAGADDFMSKPFQFQELLARINAHLRRRQLEQGIFDAERYGDLEVNAAQNTVKRGNVDIILTPREFNLLQFLLRNRERVVSRVEISQAVWDIHFSTNTNVVDVYINYLRNKIDKNFPDKLIHTVKGRGYQLSNKGHES